MALEVCIWEELLGLIQGLFLQKLIFLRQLYLKDGPIGALQDQQSKTTFLRLFVIDFDMLYFELDSQAIEN